MSDEDEALPVDREEDVLFLLLQEAPEQGLYRSELRDLVEEVDPAFDISLPADMDDYGEFMESLEFLEALGAIDNLRERHRITLTEKGAGIAGKIRRGATDDQLEAVRTVVDDA